MNKAITVLGLLGALGICCALPALAVPLAFIATSLFAIWKISLTVLLALSASSVIWWRYASCTEKLACVQARRCRQAL
jgi:membrane protein implicated in regulation of membrane protease activity